MIKLYNTLSKKKEVLKPLKKGIFTMYNCGPTVYNAPTIGNLRTYVSVDILRRVIKYNGYRVKEVMNITDIEDKIIRDSKKLGIKHWELTKKYEKVFLSDIADLNIEFPEVMPKATAEIPEMIKIISDLLKKKYAYISEDGSVYFSIGKFGSYGKLSGLAKREIKTGARVAQDEYDKDNAQDFALWKAAKKGEPSWSAPFGAGRPGWHIECSAMSTKYLGSTIDIHAGGVDLIFPHHENEIAQSEAYTGKKFVKYWFHNEHLLINSKRMGKSEGNAYTFADLREKFDVEPLAFRMLCLNSSYRDKLNFTKESIVDGQNTLHNLRSFMIRMSLTTKVGDENRVSKMITGADKAFLAAISDDLSMPKAMSVVFNFIKSVNKIDEINKKEASEVIDLMKKFDEVLGLDLKEIKRIDIPESVNKLAVDREDARKAGEYDKADKLRAQIEKKGYTVEDTPDGPLLTTK